MEKHLYQNRNEADGLPSYVARACSGCVAMSAGAYAGGARFPTHCAHIVRKLAGYVPNAHDQRSSDLVVVVAFHRLIASMLR